jgi:hypothetical protein
MAAMVWSSSSRVSRSMLSLHLTHTGPHESAGRRPGHLSTAGSATPAAGHSRQRSDFHDPYVSCDHRPGPYYPQKRSWQTFGSLTRRQSDRAAPHGQQDEFRQSGSITSQPGMPRAEYAASLTSGHPCRHRQYGRQPPASGRSGSRAADPAVLDDAQHHGQRWPDDLGRTRGMRPLRTFTLSTAMNNHTAGGCS